MKTEDVVCENCGVIFKKPSKEVNRSLKIGRKQYCSISCSKKIEQNIQRLRAMTPVTEHFKYINRRDKFSEFRQHLLRAKRRKHITDITLQDLKDVWEEQNGICPYSKVRLKAPLYYEKNDPIYTASLDRKDSSLGYIKGNIQFISIAMNLMKNSMTEEKVQELLLILKTA